VLNLGSIRHTKCKGKQLCLRGKESSVFETARGGVSVEEKNENILMIVIMIIGLALAIIGTLMGGGVLT